MKPSVPPRMVALLILTSLSSLGAESLTKPITPPAPNSHKTTFARRFSPPEETSSPAAIAAAIESKSSIPRAIPVVSAAPKAESGISLHVHRELVSFHPITVKNGPQPYGVEADSLQKGLALISQLYRKTGGR